MTTGTHTHKKTEPDEETLTLTEKLEKKLREACEKYDDIHAQVDDFSESLVKTVKKRPLTALAVAIACGIAIGKIMK